MHTFEPTRMFFYVKITFIIKQSQIRLMNSIQKYRIVSLLPGWDYSVFTSVNSHMLCLFYYVTGSCLNILQ